MKVLSILLIFSMLVGCASEPPPVNSTTDAVSSVSPTAEQSSSIATELPPQEQPPAPAPDRTSLPEMPSDYIQAISYHNAITLKTGIIYDYPLNSNRQFTYFDLTTYEHTAMPTGEGRLNAPDVIWAAMRPGNEEIVTFSIAEDDIGKHEERLELYDENGDFIRVIFSTLYHDVEVLGLNNDKVYIYKNFIAYPFIHEYSVIDIATGEEQVLVEEEVHPDFHYLDPRYMERTHHANGNYLYTAEIAVDPEYDGSTSISEKSIFTLSTLDVTTGTEQVIFSEEFLTAERFEVSFSGSYMFINTIDGEYRALNLDTWEVYDYTDILVNDIVLDDPYLFSSISGWLSGYTTTEESYPGRFVGHINIETQETITAKLMRYDWYEPIDIVADLGDSLLVMVSTDDEEGDTVYIYAVITKEDYFNNEENFHIFNRDGIIEAMRQG